jgi:hypothetical protein
VVRAHPVIQCQVLSKRGMAVHRGMGLSS